MRHCVRRHGHGPLPKRQNLGAERRAAGPAVRTEGQRLGLAVKAVGLRAGGRPGLFFAAAFLSGVARIIARNRLVAAAVAHCRRQVCLSAALVVALGQYFSTNWAVIRAAVAQRRLQTA